jgi:hypothetical protein
MTKAPAMHFRDVGVTVLESSLSTSGKYKIFLGKHWERGVVCWVVGAVSGVTGYITKQHYNDKIEGCIAPKAHAQQMYERFKARMTERSEHEEEETLIESLAPHLERARRIIDPASITRKR